MKLFNNILTLCAIGAITCGNLQAAFIVECVPTGRGYANFTGPANFSSVKSVALGCTGANSIFGMAGNSTYTFTYTLGTDADNFTPTIGANLGNGNLATGAGGGVSGNYNVYVTWPSSTNPDASGTRIEVFNDSTTVTWPTVIQINSAPYNTDFPAVNKWWCVATNVPLTAGHTYTGVSTPNNPGGFVSQRFSGVMWERTPDVVDPCSTVPLLTLTNAPYVAGTNVTVAGVDGSATKITIYQNTGAGMTQIGSKTTGIVAGVNSVTTTTPLAKGAILSATQTIGGQEGCVPTTGPYIGGGANPSVRIALSIRETTDTGPIGATATANGSTLIHFLGASAVSAGAPINAQIFSPSNDWQTVTIGGKARVDNSANAVGAVTNGDTYGGSFNVAIQVFAFKNIGETRVYSTTPAQSSTVISNGNAFAVNWTWDAVPNAEGYRVLRDVGGFGFSEGTDVATNSLVDTNSGVWGGTVETTPNSLNISPSYQWNGAGAGNTNGPATPWGIIESINFAIVDDSGSFDIYIDDLQNGDTMFQSFETVASGTQEYGFRAPGFSGTTGPLLLGSPVPRPNSSVVTNLIANTGTNSVNIKFQWGGTNASHWLRLTTSTAAGNANNPLVNLDDPISFRMLLLPVGSVVAPPAQPPTIAHSLSGDQLTLTWTGTFNLQSKTNLSEATWTNVGVSNSPYVTTVSGSAKFFRLQAP